MARHDGELKVAGEAWVKGVWRRKAIPSQGDFSQTGEGAEVVKKQQKTVRAEQVKLSSAQTKALSKTRPSEVWQSIGDSKAAAVYSPSNSLKRALGRLFRAQ